MSFHMILFKLKHTDCKSRTNISLQPLTKSVNIFIFWINILLLWKWAIMQFSHTLKIGKQWQYLNTYIFRNSKNLWYWMIVIYHTTHVLSYQIIKNVGTSGTKLLWQQKKPISCNFLFAIATFIFALVIHLNTFILQVDLLFPFLCEVQL